MKGCVQWNPFTVEMISPRMGLGPGAASSIGHHLTHRTTGAPMCLGSRSGPSSSPRRNTLFCS